MTKKIKFFAAALFSFAAMLCLSANTFAEELSFNCTVGENSITVYIKDSAPKKEDSYSLSLGAGKFFFPIGSEKVFRINHLKNGTYQLRAMKNDSILSPVKAVCVGESGINAENEIKISVSSLGEERYKEGSVRVEIENYDPKIRYIISLDGGRVWQQADGKVTEFGNMFSGCYDVMVSSCDNVKLRSRRVSITVPVKKMSESAIIRVPLTKQLPELPTGCEVTSLTMALGFYDIRVSKTSLSDYFLEKGDNKASDYKKVFVGNPRDAHSFGCYAGVIKKCADKFLSTVKTRSFEVNDISGCDPQRLYAYTDMGYPVIVWATNNMIPTVKGSEWADAETGKTVSWVANEHCMLLTGYDMKKKCVYMNDPLYGIISFDMALFEERFNDLEKQAVVIVEIKQ